MKEDVLAWLMPDGRKEHERLRRVITALRLLRDDARMRANRGAAPSWPCARGELERLEREERLRAIETLLCAYLEVLLPADSFLDLGPRRPGYEAAWRLLLDAGAGVPAVHPPGPLEPPASVIERLLATARALGAGRARVELWQARLRHAELGPVGAEKHWRSLLESTRTSLRTRLDDARLLAGLVAARLERGDPRRALELTQGRETLVAVEPGLRRLSGWSALLCHEVERARELLAPLRDLPAALPPPLAELRSLRREWQEWLAGEVMTRGAPPVLARSTRRRELGLLLLGVFAPGADGALESVHLDVPGRLLKLLARRRDERARAWCHPGEPEEEVLRKGRLVRWHSARGEDSPAALAGSATRALALVPILDPSARARGWVQVESSHHLLPSRARLESLARAWSEIVLARPLLSRPFPAREAGSLRAAEHPAEDLRAELCARALLLAPLAGRRRSYWVEPGSGAELLVRGARGAALEDWEELPGSARILRRALAERAPRSSSVLENGQGVHARAAETHVVPLLAPGAERVLGALVVEAERGSGYTAGELATLHAALARLSERGSALDFRAWHRESSGEALAWDPQSRFPSSVARMLAQNARPGAARVLLGPRGSGRRTLSRWLHRVGACSDRPWIEGPGEARGGTRVLDLGALDRTVQLELAASLAAGRDEHLHFVTEEPVHVLRERGRLTPELERELGSQALRIPALRERRDELPDLLHVALDNAARRAGLPRVRLRDEAVALLWRQDWNGHLVELGAFAAELVRSASGAVIGPAEISAWAAAMRRSWGDRLPSRRPNPFDLADALRVTRHGTGSWNRARAARYLGWDADTLARRQREARLIEPAAPREEAE